MWPALFGMLFIVPLVAWRGYVLSVLWAWFAVPTFGLPVLSVTQAIGVAIVVAMLTHQGSTEKHSEEVQSTSWTFAILQGFLDPLFALIMGWIVMRLM